MESKFGGSNHTMEHRNLRPDPKFLDDVPSPLTAMYIYIYIYIYTYIQHVYIYTYSTKAPPYFFVSLGCHFSISPYECPVAFVKRLNEARRLGVDPRFCRAYEVDA